MRSSPRSRRKSTPYEGPHAIEGIRFRALRGALEVTAWGMNVIDLDAGATGYPEHDHTKDGQEEVYVILSGEVELHAGARRHARPGLHAHPVTSAAQSNQPPMRVLTSMVVYPLVEKLSGWSS